MWVLVVAGSSDGFLMADGSLSGRMVEGPIDLARVMGLEDALPGDRKSVV